MLVAQQPGKGAVGAPHGRFHTLLTGIDPHRQGVDE
jgi:hypothetical protein